MRFTLSFLRKKRIDASRQNFDHKLAAYLAASASAGSYLATEAQGIVVSNSTVQPFGINQEVSIDFNSDGQIDFQIDHDRFNVNGVDLDFLQLDKNDVSSPANPYAIDPLATFPLNGTVANGDHGYMAQGGPGDLGFYPSALLPGAEIGPLADNWDFQEGDGFGPGGTQIIHANRLIDEDATQIDAANPNPPANKTPVVPFGSPGWVGSEGQTRYLGVRLDLNDAGQSGLNPGGTNLVWYGWIGVKLTNEADATGEVTGYGYETVMGAPILAGALAPGIAGDYNGSGTVDAADYVVWRNNEGLMGGATAAQGDGTGDGNVTSADYDYWMARFGNISASAAGSNFGLVAVPEPSTLLLALGTGLAMIGALLWRRIRRS